MATIVTIGLKDGTSAEEFLKFAESRASGCNCPGQDKNDPTVAKIDLDCPVHGPVMEAAEREPDA